MSLTAIGPTSLPARSPRRRRARRAAPLATAAAAAIWAGHARAASTYYFTGGATGTSGSWYTNANWSDADQSYNASQATSPSIYGGGPGSAVVIDSVWNAGSYIGRGGLSATSSVGYMYLSNYFNVSSVTFGNVAGQMPNTLVVDDGSGSTAYYLYLKNATDGADLITLTNDVTSTVDIRGYNGSAGGGASTNLVTYLGSNGNFNVANAAATLQIDTRIINNSSGAFGFTKTGAGTLVLTGSNTFAGSATLNGGTLVFTTVNSLGATGASAAPVYLNGGTLQYLASSSSNYVLNKPFVLGDGTTTTFDVTASGTNRLGLYVSGVVSGAGNLVVGGNGLGGTGTGSLALSAANTYTGTTTVGQGQVLLLAAGGSIGNSALTLSGGNLGLYANRTAATTAASVAVGPGASTINFITAYATAASAANSNVSGSSSLGPITRLAGGQGTLDVVVPANGTLATTTANAPGTSMLGGFATASGGTSWLAASGTLSALATFDADYAATAPVNFDATASGTLAAGGVNSLRFNAGNVTATTNGALAVASGGILATPNVTAPVTLAGGTVTSGNGSDLIVHSYGTAPLVIDAQVADNGSTPIGLTTTGTGTVVLTNANTYTGPTVVNAGTLQVGNGGTTGTLGAAPNVTVNGTLAFNRADGVTVAGVISGAGAVAQDGTGTLTLTASNAFAGGLTINSGTVAATSPDAVGAATSTNTINNGGTLSFTNPADVTTGSAGRSFSLGTGTATVNVANAGVSTYLPGAVTGSGTLVKTGAGTLALGGSNTFAGGLVINQGTVSVSSTNALGGANADGGYVTTINDGGQLLFTSSISSALYARTYVLGGGDDQIAESAGATVIVPGTISGTGTLVQNGPGTLALDPRTPAGYYTSNTYAGGTTINGGTLRIQTGNVLGTGPVTINAGSLTYTNTTYASSASYAAAVSNPVVLNDPTSTVETTSGGTAIQNLTLSGVISGTGALNKAGTQTLFLTNDANSYSGGTIVNAGTVRANNGGPSATGSATGSGAVVVNNGGTLGGDGTVAGAVTVNAGGTVTAGSATNAVGTLSTGPQTWNGGGTYLAKLSADASTTDLLVMSTLNLGNASSAAPFTISLSNVGSGAATVSGTTYVLATVRDANADTNPLSAKNLPATLSSLTLTTTTGVAVTSGFALSAQADGGGGFDLLLTEVAAAPEPASLLLAGIAVAPLMLGRRRRVR